MAISKTNLIWVIVVCLLVIISLLTGLSEASLIQSYISFTASILSIILAVIAIFYSMISNSGFQHILGEIRSSSDQISAQTSLLNSASLGLSNEAQEVLKRLDSLPQNIEALRGEVRTSLGRLKESTERPKQKSNDNDVRPVSSHALDLCLYIIVMSDKNDKSFKLDEIFKGEDVSLVIDYIRGMIEAIQYFCVKNSNIEGLEGNYLTTSVGDFNAEMIVSKIESNFENDDLLKPFKDAIDKFFTSH